MDTDIPDYPGHGASFTIAQTAYHHGKMHEEFGGTVYAFNIGNAHVSIFVTKKTPPS